MNLSSVERYDDQKNQWSYVAPLTAHEGGVGVGVLTLMPPDNYTSTIPLTPPSINSAIIPLMNRNQTTVERVQH